MYYRRTKVELGAAEAVTTTAHKLARVIYRLRYPFQLLGRVEGEERAS